MIGERAERATKSIVLKLTPSELADIDRVRGARPRTVFIKTYMRAVVKQHDRRDDDARRDEAGS